jgi:hypothetical protein
MQYKSTYDQFAKNFWHDMELSKQTSVTIHDRNEVSFPSWDDATFPFPRNDILIDIFLKRFFRDEQIYINAMSSLSAEMISCDHTFKSACNIGYKRATDGSWINQYNSIFCILNEHGQIIKGLMKLKTCFWTSRNTLEKKYSNIFVLTIIASGARY